MCCPTGSLRRRFGVVRRPRRGLPGEFLSHVKPRQPESLQSDDRAKECIVGLASRLQTALRFRVW